MLFSSSTTSIVHARCQCMRSRRRQAPRVKVVPVARRALRASMSPPWSWRPRWTRARPSPALCLGRVEGLEDVREVARRRCPARVGHRPGSLEPCRPRTAAATRMLAALGHRLHRVQTRGSRSPAGSAGVDAAQAATPAYSRMTLRFAGSWPVLDQEQDLVEERPRRRTSMARAGPGARTRGSLDDVVESLRLPQDDLRERSARPRPCGGLVEGLDRRPRGRRGDCGSRGRCWRTAPTVARRSAWRIRCSIARSSTGPGRRRRGPAACPSAGPQRPRT